MRRRTVSAAGLLAVRDDGRVFAIDERDGRIVYGPIDLSSALAAWKTTPPAVQAVLTLPHHERQ
jgi:hypothetical protein